MPCLSGRVQIFTGEGNQRGRFRVTDLASSFIRSGRTPSTATPLTPMRSVSTLACFHWCFHALRARGCGYQSLVTTPVTTPYARESGPFDQVSSNRYPVRYPPPTRARRQRARHSFQAQRTFNVALLAAERVLETERAGQEVKRTTAILERGAIRPSHGC